MGIPYKEVWTANPLERQLLEAGQEASRLTSIAITDLRQVPVRVGEDATARFGQLMLVDASRGKINILLPSTSQDDIGRTLTVKVYCSSMAGNVVIAAPLDGRLDGQLQYSLTSVFASVMVCYAGNNDWIVLANCAGSTAP